MISNDLTITVYSTGTSLIHDIGDDLAYAQALGFSTFYPGGLYGDASLYVPRDILRYWAVKGAQRIWFHNYLDVVYEGKIDHLTDIVEENSEGRVLQATGYWGAELLRRRLRRWYVDNRVDANTWEVATAGGPDEICDVRRQDDDRVPCLLFQPRREAWAANQHYDLRYICPTGETIKYVEFDTELWIVNNEDWSIRLYDVTNATELYILSGTTTGGTSDPANTITLDPVSSEIQFQFESDAAQTPAPDGSNNLSFAKIGYLKVHATTGNSGNYANNVDEIAKDLVSEFSGILNSDVRNIDTPGSPFAINPFICEWSTIAEILTQATGFGDGATPPNAWAAYLLNSGLASTYNGWPVLAVKQWPALTDYEFGVRMDDANIVAPINIHVDYSQIGNFVVVQYQSPTGKTLFVTPDDDATLKDTTSITDYGQRDIVLSFGPMDQDMAINLGYRHLQKVKDPQYKFDTPLQVKTYIDKKDGQPIPVCRICAGKRIRVLDYIPNISGSGLTSVITQTQYDADSEICTIYTGVPDDMASVIARLTLATGE